MEDLKLKPCPFCGGEPFLNKCNTTNDRYTIKCLRCKGGWGAIFMRKETAIKRWNERVITINPSLDEALNSGDGSYKP